MEQIEQTPCRKCGGITTLKYIPSSGMDYERTGLKKTCERCGFAEFIDSLDERHEKSEEIEKMLRR